MNNDKMQEVHAHYGVRDRRFKPIDWDNDDLGQLGARPSDAPPEWKLFDCEKDPSELMNVAKDPACAGVFETMLGKLDVHMATIGDVPEHDSAGGCVT